MQRKTFRIEAMLTRARSPLAQKAAPAAQPNGADVARLERELSAIYEAVDRSREDLVALAGNGPEGACMTRAGHELNAAIGGMEKATNQILKAAEAADEGARALVATLQDDYKRGVAQDVLENVTRVYEACNFQDLSGQRIAKAVATLKFVEQRIAALSAHWGGLQKLRRHAAAPPEPARLINGPRLEGDQGHASQRDIDAMFAEGGLEGCA